MNSESPIHHIFPLGDSAITIDFGNEISETVNNKVRALFNMLKAAPLKGMTEMIPAYSSLTICFEIGASKTTQIPAFEFITTQLQEKINSIKPLPDDISRQITIPVCYESEFAADLDNVAAAKGLAYKELIELHSAVEYRVYMLGFIPGFAYLGNVDERLSMPRKAQPSQVLPGSVAITGKQTGIYPFLSPGGWHVIGRTPLRLFDATKDQPSLLSPGDKVRFVSISKHEFENY